MLPVDASKIISRENESLPFEYTPISTQVENTQTNLNDYSKQFNEYQNTLVS